MNKTMANPSVKPVNVQSKPVLGSLTLQRKCACGWTSSFGECEDCKNAHEASVYRSAGGEASGGAVPPIVRGVLQSPGAPLDAQAQASMASAFGDYFSRIPIHSEQRPAGAKAFRISHPSDPAEIEADRIADQVMCGGVWRGGERGSARVPQILRQANPSGQTTEVPNTVHQVLNSGGRPLDSTTRSFFESSLGHDFSQVRVHTGVKATEAARALQAQAFTLGRNLVFAEASYQPATFEGRRLLAHELTHVVQQQSASKDESLIQRFGPMNRGAAGGCGVCRPDFMNVGTEVHQHLQAAFQLFNPSEVIVAEQVIIGANEPSMDLFHITDDSVNIGEIKPFNPEATLQGLDILKGYHRELFLSGMFEDKAIGRMTLNPPPPVLYDNPAHPPTCPRQFILVERTAPGLYQYICEPPWSVLVRDPKCKCKTKEEKEEEQRAANIVILDLDAAIRANPELIGAIEPEIKRKYAQAAVGSEYLIAATPGFAEEHVLAPLREQQTKYMELGPPGRVSPVVGMRNLAVTLGAVAVGLYAGTVVIVLTGGTVLEVAGGAAPATVSPAAAAGTGGAEVIELAAYRAAQQIAQSAAAQEAAKAAGTLLVVGVATEAAAGEFDLSSVETVRAIPAEAFETERAVSLLEKITFEGQSYIVIGRARAE